MMLKKFHKVAAPRLDQGQERAEIGIILKKKLSRFSLVFTCDSFSMEL